MAIFMRGLTKLLYVFTLLYVLSISVPSKAFCGVN